MFFDDRYDAGEKLAQIVKSQSKDRWDVVGIARGGIVIADQIARALNVETKAICVEDILTKQGYLTISSLGSGMLFGKKNQFIKNASTYDIGLYLGSLGKQQRITGNLPSNYGSRVLLCDDGIVSGRTVVTAIQCLKNYGVKTVAVAIPVVLPWVLTQGFQVFAWRVSKMTNPTTGMFYKNFDDTTDLEAAELLRKSRRLPRRPL